MKTKLLLTVISIAAICIMSFGQGYIKIDATMYSETLQEEKNIDIYLPGDYYSNLEQEYATIYYLHGAGSNQNGGNIDAMYYYNTYYEDTVHSAPPAIFVCMDGSCEPYRGSCYMNSVLYGDYEDYTINDIIGFIEDNFRAIPDKNFRFITGWSMGGTGSARLSLIYPEMFRACIPCIGFFRTDSDTLLNTWAELCYNEHGSYNFTYSGTHTRLLFTMCGALSPNMDIEPYHIEIPFDTLGNFVDTVIDKWKQHDLSAMVKDLPPADELSWYLIAGKYDHMASYTTYLDFMDSLDYYGIDYDSNYFEGGHEFDEESWVKAIHWVDSIMEISFSSLGIPVYEVNDQLLTVYPNPATDQLNIQSPRNENILEVKVYSQNGKVVIHRRESGQVLDVSFLSPGIYILEARTGSGIMRGKFIKR